MEIKEELLKNGFSSEQADGILELVAARYVEADRLSEYEAELDGIRAEKDRLEGELGRCRLEYSAERALWDAGAKNARMLLKLIGTEGMELGEDGAVSGLPERIEALKLSDPYLFGESRPVLRGFVPEQAGDISPDGRVDFSDMTYSEVVDYMSR